MEERSEKNEKRTQNTEEGVTKLLKLHVKLDERLAELESRFRRENVRIYSVPEVSEKDSELMITFMETLLKDGLDLDNIITDLHIEKANWAPGPLPPENASSPSILVRFSSLKMKETFLR